MMINLTREEAQVPLVEQLESVPQDARLCIDDADGMGTHYFPIGYICHEAAKALRAKLSEPEPEPVATQYKYIDAFGNDYWTDEPWEGKKVEAERYLYTAPPQREWVGLTEEDIKDIEGWIEFKEAGSNERVPLGKLAFYISHKIREKNT